MKLFLDEADNTHDAVYMDGYDIADRLLEGVMIKIQVADDGAVSASFLDEDSGYVSSLNEEKLLKQACESVEDLIAGNDLGSLSPSPNQGEPYDMIVGVIDGPVAAPASPAP